MLKVLQPLANFVLLYCLSAREQGANLIYSGLLFVIGLYLALCLSPALVIVGTSLPFLSLIMAAAQN